MLDVGCGGGILSESLARMGAQVTGIDVSEENIAVARVHAQHDPDIERRIRWDVPHYLLLIALVWCVSCIRPWRMLACAGVQRSLHAPGVGYRVR